MRANTIVGMVIAAVGLFYLSRVPVDGSYVGDLSGLLLMAFGMGNTFVPITLIATTNVQERDAGLASGLFNTSQQVGGALGLAVLDPRGRQDGELSGKAFATSRGREGGGAGGGLPGRLHVAAIIVTVGAILLAVLLRSRDVANVNPEQGMVYFFARRR